MSRDRRAEEADLGVGVRRGGVRAPARRRRRCPPAPRCGRASRAGTRARRAGRTSARVPAGGEHDRHDDTGDAARARTTKRYLVMPAGRPYLDALHRAQSRCDDTGSRLPASPAGAPAAGHPDQLLRRRSAIGDRLRCAGEQGIPAARRRPRWPCSAAPARRWRRRAMWRRPRSTSRPTTRWCRRAPRSSAPRGRRCARVQREIEGECPEGGRGIASERRLHAAEQRGHRRDGDERLPHRRAGGRQLHPRGRQPSLEQPQARRARSRPTSASSRC